MANGADKRKPIKLILSVIFTIMLSGSLQTYAQEDAGNRLSDEDKTEIIRSILQQIQSSFFTSSPGMYLSLENIEFIKPSAVSEFRMELIGGFQLAQMKEGSIHAYIVFRSLEMNGGKVRISLSKITEGRPCFGPPFSHEQQIAYAYSKEAGQWKGEMIRHPVPVQFSSGRNLNLKQPKYVWAKPDKMFNQTHN